MAELTPERDDGKAPATGEELSIVMGRRFEQGDRRFEQVDQRFDQADAAIVEQRQYTEVALGKLERELVVVKIGAGFTARVATSELVIPSESNE